MINYIIKYDGTDVDKMCRYLDQYVYNAFFIISGDLTIIDHSRIDPPTWLRHINNNIPNISMYTSSSEQLSQAFTETLYRDKN